MIKPKYFILDVDGVKKGFGISQKRIQKDLGYDLKLISEEKRYDYLSKNFDLVAVSW